MLNQSPPKPIRFGALIGLLSSSLLGVIYILLLQEPPAAFYPFAILALLVSPILAGFLAARRAQQRKLWSAFAATGLVLFLVWAGFIFIYAVYIRVETQRVPIPALCDGSYALTTLPGERGYTLPDGTAGVIINRDAQTSVIASVDSASPSRPTTITLINNESQATVGQITFPNDIVAVAMDAGTAYIFHEGIGHSIRAATGDYEPFFLTMDAYGTNTDGSFETTGVFSSWSEDGSVKLRPYLFFNGIAKGCYIDGRTQNITKL